MVARTQPSSGLIVAFHRQGEPVESLFARDGDHAWAHAIHMITRRETLYAGDSLLILDAASPEGDLESFARILRGAA